MLNCHTGKVWSGHSLYSCTFSSIQKKSLESIIQETGPLVILCTREMLKLLSPEFQASHLKNLATSEILTQVSFSHIKYNYFHWTQILIGFSAFSKSTRFLQIIPERDRPTISWGSYSSPPTAQWWRWWTSHPRRCRTTAIRGCAGPSQIWVWSW